MIRKFPPALAESKSEITFLLFLFLKYFHREFSASSFYTKNGRITLLVFRVVESEKNSGWKDSSGEDLEKSQSKNREKDALVMTSSRATHTNYTLVCSPQLLIREVFFS